VPGTGQTAPERRPVDAELAAAIERDNEQADAGLHGDDRATCWAHTAWAKDCEDLH